MRTGVVVIGRNEGERLRRCLASLDGAKSGAVYVDSGSTDGSVDLASSMAWDVVELDPSTPFTAARARNEGFEHLVRTNPDMEFVQFVDGDCELVDGWLERAEQEMDEDPDVVAAAGRLKERNPELSVYNLLCDMEWSLAFNESESCGGIFMVRAGPFRKANGFDGDIGAGEEPELCERLRSRGWKIAWIDAEMARHDAAMFHFRQWCMRRVRFGFGTTDLAHRLRGTGKRFCSKALRSMILWAVGWPATVVLAGVFGALVFGRGAGMALMASALSILPLQVTRVGVKMWSGGETPRRAVLYGVFTVLGKWPELLGCLRYWWQQFTGRGGSLIEHKLDAPVEREAHSNEPA